MKDRKNVQHGFDPQETRDELVGNQVTLEFLQNQKCSAVSEAEGQNSGSQAPKEVGNTDMKAIGFDHSEEEKDRTSAKEGYLCVKVICS